jgi:hypothetical protein
MRFTEPGIKFLIQPHLAETTDRCGRPLAAAIDLRELGCLAHIFERVLESRARRLGSKFTELRAHSRHGRAHHGPWHVAQRRKVILRNTERPLTAQHMGTKLHHKETI